MFTASSNSAHVSVLISSVQSFSDGCDDRHGERTHARERERVCVCERARGRECVCACASVSERERERERERETHTHTHTHTHTEREREQYIYKMQGAGRKPLLLMLPSNHLRSYPQTHLMQTASHRRSRYTILHSKI